MLQAALWGNSLHSSGAFCHSDTSLKPRFPAALEAICRTVPALSVLGCCNHDRNAGHSNYTRLTALHWPGQTATFSATPSVYILCLLQPAPGDCTKRGKTPEECRLFSLRVDWLLLSALNVMAEPLLILPLNCKYKSQRLRFISDYSCLVTFHQDSAYLASFRHPVLCQFSVLPFLKGNSSPQSHLWWVPMISYECKKPLFCLFGTLEWKIFLLLCPCVW